MQALARGPELREVLLNIFENARLAKASDAAMGIRNCACNEGSKRIGNKPAKVVAEVRKIGRKRRVPD